MITSKTTDRLLNRALEINAISEAVYEAGFKQEADELAKLAGELAAVSSRMREKLETYAKSALANDNS